MAAPPLTEPAAFPKKLHGLAENMPGEGQGKASASELPYGGSLLLWQQHGSTAEAACESAAAKRSSKRLVRGAGGRLFQKGKQHRTEEKLFIIVKYNDNKNICLWTKKTLTRKEE